MRNSSRHIMALNVAVVQVFRYAVLHRFTLPGVLLAATLSMLWMLQMGTANVRKPNILVVMTDDQDYMLNSTDPAYMPNLHRLIRQRGLEVRHFITSVASCCPSRTSFLTGRYCHNTNITSNAWPRGGHVKFMMDGLDEQYLPVWLQAAGYDTYYVGKFLNGVTADSLRELGCPRGWTTMEAMLLGDTGGAEELYYKDSPAYMRDCRRIETFPDTFGEVVVRQKALEFIDHAAASASVADSSVGSSSRKPFFLMVSTFTPHDALGDSSARPDVEAKYQGMYNNISLPPSPNFGVRPPEKIGYYWPYNSKDAIPSITTHYRMRLEALRSVDDTVAALVSRLGCRGLLNDTVIIYTSDNGFKLGNHNIAQEKFTQYEEDVRLPLLIAGPGVPRGVATGAEMQVAMTDLTATILALAGAKSGNMELDGSPIPLSDLVSYFAGRRPPPATAPITPPDGDGKAYCAPAPPPDPPRPPAPPQPPPFPPRTPETSITGPGEEEIGNGEVRRHLASAAAAAAAAEAAIAADGVVTATGHAPLTHLLGSWRPEGWRWHHDIWLQDHATELGLQEWAERVRYTAAAAASLGDSMLGVLGRNTTTIKATATSVAARTATMTATAAAAAAAAAAITLDPLPSVPSSLLKEYSLQRVRTAVQEAKAILGKRAQAAAAMVVATEAEAPRRTLMMMEATNSVSGMAVGRQLPQSSLSSWSNVALIESWLDTVFKNKNYRTVRACTTYQAFQGKGNTCYKYTVLCNPVQKQTPVLTNVELYDLGQDPAEIRDRTKNVPYDAITDKLVNRLNAILTVLSYCKGDLCRNPFLRVHPDGSVHNLAQAMQPLYDNMYDGFKKFTYARCQIIYDPANEQPDPYLAGRTDRLPSSPVPGATPGISRVVPPPPSPPPRPSSPQPPTPLQQLPLPLSLLPPPSPIPFAPLRPLRPNRNLPPPTFAEIPAPPIRPAKKSKLSPPPLAGMVSAPFPGPPSSPSLDANLQPLPSPLPPPQSSPPSPPPSHPRSFPRVLKHTPPLPSSSSSPLPSPNPGPSVLSTPSAPLPQRSGGGDPASPPPPRPLLRQSPLSPTPSLHLTPLSPSLSSPIPFPLPSPLSSPSASVPIGTVPVPLMRGDLLPPPVRARSQPPPPLQTSLSPVLALKQPSQLPDPVPTPTRHLPPTHPLLPRASRLPPPHSAINVAPSEATSTPVTHPPVASYSATPPPAVRTSSPKDRTSPAVRSKSPLPPSLPTLPLPAPPAPLRPPSSPQPPMPLPLSPALSPPMTPLPPVPMPVAQPPSSPVPPPELLSMLLLVHSDHPLETPTVRITPIRNRPPPSPPRPRKPLRSPMGITRHVPPAVLPSPRASRLPPPRLALNITPAAAIPMPVAHLPGVPHSATPLPTVRTSSPNVRASPAVRLRSPSPPSPLSLPLPAPPPLLSSPQPPVPKPPKPPPSPPLPPSPSPPVPPPSPPPPSPLPVPPPTLPVHSDHPLETPAVRITPIRNRPPLSPPRPRKPLRSPMGITRHVPPAVLPSPRTSPASLRPPKLPADARAPPLSSTLPPTSRPRIPRVPPL